jgi:hypothetical protein
MDRSMECDPITVFVGQTSCRSKHPLSSPHAHPNATHHSTPLHSTAAPRYLAYNLARKALAVAAPGLQQGRGEGGLRLSKTDLGLVSSSFTAMYGASKFAGSVITGAYVPVSACLPARSDRTTESHRVHNQLHQPEHGSGTGPPWPLYHTFPFTHNIPDHVSCRALFSLGLVLTGVLCFVFSLSDDLPRLCLLWSLHGVVQVRPSVRACLPRSGFVSPSL